MSKPAAPQQIATVYQDCGSHTNTLLPAPRGKSMFVLNSSYPLGEGPTCGPLGAAQGRKVNHGVVQVVEVPFRDPTAAREVEELPIVYPGDADGTYKPVSEHGIVAPLDDFLGCHDLSSFPAKGIVGAACGEQAQVWEIDRRTGLPDTADPKWAYDQPNVDFWHSATFSWDGKIANFIDESFGDGCPTVTTKTGGLAGGPREFQTGNMFFFDTKRGRLLSEYRNPRLTNDNTSPTTGKYCSSHLGIPVPAKDRYLLVNAFYRSGSSVIDFSDPTRPKEIAFADMDGTNTWSAYTYPRRSGRPEQHPGVLERRPQPQLRHRRRPAVSGGRLRLPAVPGARSAGGSRRVRPPEPAAAGARHPREARSAEVEVVGQRRARTRRASPRRRARATARRGRQQVGRAGGGPARAGPPRSRARFDPAAEERLEAAGDEDVERGRGCVIAVLEIVGDPRRDEQERPCRRIDHVSPTRNDIVPSVTRKISSFAS